MSIPIALTNQRSGFLFALATPQATQTLQENWSKLSISFPTSPLLPPTGLSVSQFRHENFVCYLVVFPAPRVAGEAYFGFIAAGPTDDFSPEARAKVPVRYFLLERSPSDTPTMLEWRPSDSKGEETFESLGPGPSPNDPRDFVGTLLSRFFGLNTNA